MYDWSAIGISTGGQTSGERKTLCPQCSAGRKHKSDKCLSVNLGDGVFRCHNCDWSGKAQATGQYRTTQHWERPKKNYQKPAYQVAQTEPAQAMLDWFAKRGIPAEIVKRHQIEVREVWMPQSEQKERAIAFPYFRNGEVVNVKYRTVKKYFRMEGGAELCLYGLDDITGEDVIFVEGELDKLALEVAGFVSVVSVPNGAGTNLDCLASDSQKFDKARRFILAGDNDTPGKELEQALISRLGRDRCWQVSWPEDCKDANDVLLKHGKEMLMNCIRAARPMPIEGLFEVNDIRAQVFDLWERGTPQGADPGWDNLNALYKPRLGTWTAIISIPKSGKTAWMAALMVNLARAHGWRFAVFPAENLPAEEYVSMLAEIYLGLPFNRGYHQRMNEQQLGEALDWLQEHFVILSPDDSQRDLDSLLAIGKTYCLRRGIQGFVIDPFNELEISRPQGISETEYIGKCLIKIRRFAKTHNLHVWVIVHPTKLQKDRDGKYPVPTLYDANGSAHWRNKCDYGISIYRHFDDPDKPTEIHVQAVRWKGTGEIGTAELFYDKVTGRYSEQATEWRIAEEMPRKLHNPDYKNYLEARESAEAEGNYPEF
jgi:twinkle protein